MVSVLAEAEPAYPESILTPPRVWVPLLKRIALSIQMILSIAIGLGSSLKRQEEEGAVYLGSRLALVLVGVRTSWGDHSDTVS